MSSAEDTSVQLTQSTLGKYVTKPNLSEKLLKKPPFRFLHDIVCVVVNGTGYLKGLFTNDELLSANVKEREAKVVFLNKLIGAVKATTKVDLKVRASKIIAGLEPIETNKLLQTIAKAIEDNIDSTDYVNSISGPPKEKPAKASRTTKDKVKESKGSTRSSETKVKAVTSKSSEKLKEPPSSTRSNSKSDLPEKKVREKKTIEKKSSKDSIPSTDRKERKRNDSKIKKEEKASPKENKQKKPKTIETIKEDQILVPEKPQKVEKPVSNSVREDNDVDEAANIPPIDSFDDNVDGNDVPQTKVAIESKPLFERPKTAKISDNMTQLIKDNQNDSIKTSIASRAETQSTNASSIPNEPSQSITKTTRPPSTVPNNRPYSSLPPPSARPGTARPAAPRLRPPSALPPSDTVIANGLAGLGNVKVVMEQYKNSLESDDADDEETVVVEQNDDDLQAVTTLSSNTLDDISGSAEAAATKSHLVGQIMAQVGQEDQSRSSRAKAGAVQVQLFQGDKPVAELAASIQTVTQSANRLGQLMGYLHEDIDAMRAELEHWSQVARATMTAADKRRSELAERSRPLRAKLQEVEDEIQRQKEDIATLQCTIQTDHARIEAQLRREVAGITDGAAVPIYD